MTRQESIILCERGIVPCNKWKFRDTPEAQQRLGTCWALLKAGCPLEITEQANDFIDLMIGRSTFTSIENGDTKLEWLTFYVPTQQLDHAKGSDWY